MTVRQFQGADDTYSIKVEPKQTVLEVKRLLGVEIGVSAESINIRYNDQCLKNDQIFSEVVPESTDIKPFVDYDENEEEEFDDSELPQIYDITTQSEVRIPDYNPPDFDQKVTQLMELGKDTPEASQTFSKERCEKALRLAYFNIQRAAEYLLTFPELPSKPTTMPFPPNFKPGDIFMPAKESSPILRNYTQEEYNTLKSILQETKADFATGVQMFEACDRNRDLTIQNLLQ